MGKTLNIHRYQKRSLRSHVNSYGVTKIAYATYEAAAETCERLNARPIRRKPCEPYRCPYCDLYHVGRSGRKVQPLDWEPELMIELGDRAYFCLVGEQTHANAHIMSRMAAAEKRRLRQAG